MAPKIREQLSSRHGRVRRTGECGLGLVVGAGRVWNAAGYMRETFDRTATLESAMRQFDRAAELLELIPN